MPPPPPPRRWVGTSRTHRPDTPTRPRAAEYLHLRWSFTYRPGTYRPANPTPTPNPDPDPDPDPNPNQVCRPAQVEAIEPQLDRLPAPHQVAPRARQGGAAAALPAHGAGAWRVHGVCMACAWCVHGVCMACAWCVHGVCMLPARGAGGGLTLRLRMSGPRYLLLCLLTCPHARVLARRTVRCSSATIG